MKTSTQLSSYLAQFLEKEMFRKKVVEKFKTHILCSVTFFANRVVYELMWIKHCRAGQVTDDNMVHKLAFWIPKATNTQSEYLIFIDFPLQQYL
jgi:hypothetical protein